MTDWAAEMVAQLLDNGQDEAMGVVSVSHGEAFERIVGAALRDLSTQLLATRMDRKMLVEFMALIASRKDEPEAARVASEVLRTLAEIERKS